MKLRFSVFLIIQAFAFSVCQSAFCHRSLVDVDSAISISPSKSETILVLNSKVLLNRQNIPFGDVRGFFFIPQLLNADSGSQFHSEIENAIQAIVQCTWDHGPNEDGNSTSFSGTECYLLENDIDIKTIKKIFPFLDMSGDYRGVRYFYSSTDRRDENSRRTFICRLSRRIIFVSYGLEGLRMSIDNFIEDNRLSLASRTVELKNVDSNVKFIAMRHYSAQTRDNYSPLSKHPARLIDDPTAVGFSISSQSTTLENLELWYYSEKPLSILSLLRETSKTPIYPTLGTFNIQKLREGDNFVHCTLKSSKVDSVNTYFLFSNLLGFVPYGI